MFEKQHGDILIEIPDDELPALATLYQEKATWAPWMVNFVRMAARWKKLEKYHDTVLITSPKNSWKENGTIIGIIKLERHVIVVFTLQDDCSNLYQGLMETELIDYSKRIEFYAIYEKHTPTVLKCLEEKKLEIDTLLLAYFYGLSPEKGKKLKIDEYEYSAIQLIGISVGHDSKKRPSDVDIKKLRKSDAKKIGELWPHNYPGAAGYISSFIEANGGFGVFLKSTNEPVSWVLRHVFDHFGFLQTDEKHKKKGYGSLVSQVLAKEIVRDGSWALSTILRENNASIGLFEKIGFENVGKCTFIGLKS